MKESTHINSLKFILTGVSGKKATLVANSIGGGFIFGVLSAVAETLKLPEETLLDGLFVAADVGAICYTHTAPTGEVIGCTGECGCCAAPTARELSCKFRSWHSGQ